MVSQHPSVGKVQWVSLELRCVLKCFLERTSLYPPVGAVEFVPLGRNHWCVERNYRYSPVVAVKKVSMGQEHVLQFGVERESQYSPVGAV